MLGPQPGCQEIDGARGGLDTLLDRARLHEIAGQVGEADADVGRTGAEGACLGRDRLARVVDGLREVALRSPHRRAVVEVPAPEVVVLAHAAQQHLRVPAPGVRQVEARLQVAVREDDVRRGLRGDLVVAGQLGAPDRLFETGDRGVRPAGVVLEACLGPAGPPRAWARSRPGARLRAPARIVPALRDSGRRARGRADRRCASATPSRQPAWPRRSGAARPRAGARCSGSVPGAGSAIAALDRVLDHLRVAARNSRQSAARSRSPSMQARDAQVQNLGRLLAAHVRRLAGVDVEVRPALRRSDRAAVASGRRSLRRRPCPSPGRRGGPRPSRAQLAPALRRTGSVQMPSSCAAAPLAKPVRAAAGRAIDLGQEIVHRREAVRRIRGQPALQREPQPRGDRFGRPAARRAGLRRRCPRARRASAPRTAAR